MERAEQKLSRERHRFTNRETVLWKYRHGITKGKSQHMSIWAYGHLAQFKGWPARHAHKHLTWRQMPLQCLTAERMLKELNSGFAKRGTHLKCKIGSHIPPLEGNGTVSETQRQFSYTLRVLPNTQEETSSTGRLYYSMSTSEAPRQCSEGSNTLRGMRPHSKGARLAVGLVHQSDGLHYQNGSASAWRQPFPSADLQSRQRAAQSF